jgi:hypothetical protein
MTQEMYWNLRKRQAMIPCKKMQYIIKIKYIIKKMEEIIIK